MFCTWIFRQVRAERITIKWNPVFSPMAGFGALALIQLVPGVSAYRHATYSTLLLYTAYGFVCFLLTQFLERTSHLSKLGLVFSVYGVTVAVFAVLQSLSASGKLYWIRTPRFGGWIYGPYVNHNHYAGLMEMLTPIPLVFFLIQRAQGWQKAMAAVAAGVMTSTVFLSGSSGGMVAFIVQIAVIA